MKWWQNIYWITDRAISGLLRKQGQTDAIVVAEVEPLSLQPKKYQGRPLGDHIQEALRKEARGLPAPTLFGKGQLKETPKTSIQFPLACVYVYGVYICL